MEGVSIERLLTEQVEAMYLQIKNLERLLKRAKPYTLNERSGNLYQQITQALQREPASQRRRA